MNWKKNGYTIGDKVFLIGEFMFTNRKVEYTGTVIHAGIKILKVRMEDNTVLKFERRGSSSGSWGMYYTVFKSKEEYESLIALKEAKECMIKDLNDRIKNLSIEQLKDVEKLINSFNIKH